MGFKANIVPIKTKQGIEYSWFVTLKKTEHWDLKLYCSHKNKARDWYSWYVTLKKTKHWDLIKLVCSHERQSKVVFPLTIFKMELILGERILRNHHFKIWFKNYGEFLKHKKRACNQMQALFCIYNLNLIIHSRLQPHQRSLRFR